MKSRLISSALLFIGLALMSFLLSEGNRPTSTAFDFSAHSEPASMKRQTVTIAATTFTVEVAVTEDEQAKGLADRSNLAPGEGMLFPFSPPQIVSFWMKDMRFPLDIVWISDGKVVGIERNVPVPAPGTETQSLPTYRPPTFVDHVLELNAGESDKFAVGDTVTIVNLIST